MIWFTYVSILLDGIAIGVLAQAFADGRRRSRAEERAPRSLAEFQARMAAADATLDEREEART